MNAQIPTPKPPTPVELIDIDTIPDEQCNWRDGNEWESEIHLGYRCDRCNEISECIFCHENQPNTECARNRAKEDNRIRQREYEVPYWGEPNYGHQDGCPGITETEKRNGITRDAGTATVVDGKDTGRHHFNGGTTSVLRVRADWEPPVGRHRAEDRHSIVRALTAEFQDHSSPDRCRCAERAEGPLTPLSPRAQPDPGGDAGSGTNFQK